MAENRSFTLEVHHFNEKTKCGGAPWWDQLECTDPARSEFLWTRNHAHATSRPTPPHFEALSSYHVRVSSRRPVQLTSNLPASCTSFSTISKPSAVALVVYRLSFLLEKKKRRRGGGTGALGRWRSTQSDISAPTGKCS